MAAEVDIPIIHSGEGGIPSGGRWVSARRVAIIDDDVGTLEILPRFFRLEGFDSATASSGAEGLCLLRSQPFDVLILDLYLPDMSGLALLEEARRVKNHLPVVMVSGFGTVEEAATAMKLGAADFLSKPIDADKLVGIVRSMASASSTRPLADGAAGPAPDDVRSDRLSDDDLYRLAQAAIDDSRGRADLDLGAVAALLGVSKWRLSRTFSACGSDFRACLRHARMLYAGSRLRVARAASVKEVAFDVGYRHHSDFTRHFREHWGMTPREFRDQHKAGRIAR